MVETPNIAENDTPSSPTVRKSCLIKRLTSRYVFVLLAPHPGLGSDHRGARPWPAPDRRTLAEAYSCPCRAAHFELRSFHDSGAWPPRTLELLRLCFCIRFSIPWV